MMPTEEEQEKVKSLLKYYDVVIPYPFEDTFCRRCNTTHNIKNKKKSPLLYLLQLVRNLRPGRFMNFIYCMNCNDLSPVLMPEDVGTSNYFPWDGRP
jgi:ribosomal protein L40E